MYCLLPNPSFFFVLLWDNFYSEPLRKVHISWTINSSVYPVKLPRDWFFCKWCSAVQENCEKWITMCVTLLTSHVPKFPVLAHHTFRLSFVTFPQYHGMLRQIYTFWQLVWLYPWWIYTIKHVTYTTEFSASSSVSVNQSQRNDHIS
jgi:hypothetical protein